MSAFDAVWNLGFERPRCRLQSAHKPLVRFTRRQQPRDASSRRFATEAQAIERRIAGVAAGPGPIVVGPWLAEVGYEVLYWVPFLRWFQDAYGVPRERLIVVSRGGLDQLYRPLAAGYVDLFDLTTPEELASRNAERRASARRRRAEAVRGQRVRSRAGRARSGEAGCRRWPHAAPVAALRTLPQCLVWQPADGLLWRHVGTR